MKTIQCDRCKTCAPISDSDDFRLIEISGLTSASPYLTIDLCPECIKKLHDFLQKGE